MKTSSYYDFYQNYSVSEIGRGDCNERDEISKGQATSNDCVQKCFDSGYWMTTWDSSTDNCYCEKNDKDDLTCDSFALTSTNYITYKVKYDQSFATNLTAATILTVTLIGINLF